MTATFRQDIFKIVRSNTSSFQENTFQQRVSSQESSFQFGAFSSI
ncbi:hypothetical protein [Alcanivorax quisquiliarum]|nr:hypothetical protein [Alcanivorax quisquiliarum]